MRQSPLDGHHQLVVDEWLGKEVERTGPDRVDGHIAGAVTGHHQHLGSRPAAEGLLEEVEAVVLAQPDVDQGYVVRGLFAGGVRLAARAGRIEFETQASQPVGHRLEHLVIVVNK